MANNMNINFGKKENLLKRAKRQITKINFGCQTCDVYITKINPLGYKIKRDVLATPLWIFLDGKTLH